MYPVDIVRINLPFFSCVCPKSCGPEILDETRTRSVTRGDRDRGVYVLLRVSYILVRQVLVRINKFLFTNLESGLILF